MATKKPAIQTRIADNKKAAYNYFFEEKFEAGMVLEGWEVKAAREGKVQLTDGYVVIRDGELYLIGCQINPLHTASSHVTPDKVRTKKLLMKKDEIKRLIGNFLVRTLSGVTWLDAVCSGLIWQPIKYSSPSRMTT